MPLSTPPPPGGGAPSRSRSTYDRKGVTELPRPGLVLEVDRSTPPTLFWHGENFRLERLPVGSRVLYAPEPVAPLEDPRGAIRHALLNPLGDSRPLPDLMRPGMRLSIAFD